MNRKTTRAASSNDIKKIQLPPSSGNNAFDDIPVDNNEKELVSPGHNIPKADIVEDDQP